MQRRQSELTKLDLAVAAVTYDAVSQNREFSSDNGLFYELLSDEGGETVSRLGIRNEDYEEGSFAYGVANPGIMLVDSDGKIVLKRAEEKYSDRPDFDELVKAVKAAVSEDGESDKSEE